jgi:putative PIN family toxin of toxin-antitoxin system
MIVLDTNILVAALWSQTGASYRIIELVLKREIAICVSVALALEHEDVLTRAKMREASWASDSDLDTLLDALLLVAERVAPIKQRLRPILRDADDDMVLECAIQSGAGVIVTMNIKDFADVAKRFGIEILQPGKFLEKHFGGRL